jgi:hypothetical protein
MNESRVGGACGPARMNESRVGGACGPTRMNESRVGGACGPARMNESRVGGACGPPPPFVAPLVPRCALTTGATPRDVLAAAYGSAGRGTPVAHWSACGITAWSCGRLATT